MNDRFDVGTFIWGVVLTVAGAALAAVGLGWWDLSSIDLRYVAPVFVILVGVVILFGSLMTGGRDQGGTDRIE
jgi:hypothetical protein